MNRGRHVDFLTVSRTNNNRHPMRSLQTLGSHSGPSSPTGAFLQTAPSRQNIEQPRTRTGSPAGSQSKYEAIHVYWAEYNGSLGDITIYDGRTGRPRTGCKKFQNLHTSTLVYIGRWISGSTILIRNARPSGFMDQQVLENRPFYRHLPSCFCHQKAIVASFFGKWQDK